MSKNGEITTNKRVTEGLPHERNFSISTSWFDQVHTENISIVEKLVQFSLSIVYEEVLYGNEKNDEKSTKRDDNQRGKKEAR
jgi:hypothetical protein